MSFVGNSHTGNPAIDKHINRGLQQARGSSGGSGGSAQSARGMAADSARWAARAGSHSGSGGSSGGGGGGTTSGPVNTGGAGSGGTQTVTVNMPEMPKMPSMPNVSFNVQTPQKYQSGPLPLNAEQVFDLGQRRRDLTRQAEEAAVRLNRTAQSSAEGFRAERFGANRDFQKRADAGLLDLAGRGRGMASSPAGGGGLMRGLAADRDSAVATARRRATDKVNQAKGAADEAYMGMLSGQGMLANEQALMQSKPSNLIDPVKW